MSGPQQQMSAHSPDPRIRGMLGGPQTAPIVSGFLPNNPQMISPNFTPNAWNVIGGQSPQDVGGAFDPNGLEETIEGQHYWQYVARACGDKRHQYIVTGDLVFGIRSPSQTTGVITMMNLWGFNYALREGYKQCMLKFMELKHDDQYSDVEFLSESDLYGTRWYDEKWSAVDTAIYPSGKSRNKNARKGNNVYDDRGGDDGDDEDAGFGQLEHENETIAATIRAPNINEHAMEIRAVLALRTRSDVYSTRNAGVNLFADAVRLSLETDLKETVARENVYRASKDFWNAKKDKMVDGLSYLYAGSILDKWTWLGVVRSSSNDSEPSKTNQKAPGRGGTQVSVTVSNKTHTLLNFFNNSINMGSLLFVILKRVRSNSGDWGEFQAVPFSNGLEHPTIEDREYVDVSGARALGYVWPLGYASEGLMGVVKPQGLRAVAAGLDPSADFLKMHTCSNQLENLTAHIRTGTQFAI